MPSLEKNVFFDRTKFIRSEKIFRNGGLQNGKLAQNWRKNQK